MLASLFAPSGDVLDADWLLTVCCQRVVALAVAATGCACTARTGGGLCGMGKPARGAICRASATRVSSA